MSKHPLNTFFDKIYCINLIDQIDRKNKVKKRFEMLGIDVEFFSSIKYGFLNNILNIFKSNKENGHDFQFIGERC